MKRSSSYDLRSFEKRNSDRQANSDINMLDDQLAEIIFKFVPMCQWSSRLEYVSKKFRLCVKLAYSRIKFVNLKRLFSLSKPIVPSFLGAKKLLFSKYGTIRLNNILEWLLTVCPNLRGISGFECIARKMNAKSTWNILLQFHRLQSLAFEDDNQSNELNFCHFADFVANCESFEMLTITICNFQQDITLNVGKLTSLDCTTSTGYYIRPIFLENLSEKLTTLKLDCLDFYFKPDNSCAENALKKCVNLESFTVQLVSLRDKEIFINVLPHLTNLTTLRVTSDRNLNLDEIFCVQLDLIKSQLKCLEFGFIELSDEVQQFSVSKCIGLESLKFSGLLSSLSTKVMKKLTNFPGNLKEFAFPDKDGRMLPILMPSLVKLSNLVNLTIGGYVLTKEWENLACLVNLKNLCVEGVGIVDDSLLKKWDEKNDKIFENLVVLELPRCKSISDAGACLFAKKAVNLKILDLFYAKITTKTVLVLSDVAKKLTMVNFMRCKKLVDENVLLYFIEKAKKLKKLKISEILWKKLARLDGLLAFIEDVEIDHF